ncbi:hypothetical protein PCE1_002145 [Barthelona sp. PCE]
MRKRIPKKDSDGKYISDDQHLQDMEKAMVKNPKAFTFQKHNKAVNLMRRSMDIDTLRQKVPEMKDTTKDDSVPVVVAVVGPSKVGKSTFIRSMFKYYTKRNLNEIKGPITCVVSKTRRITFLECNNDLNSMIDMAKIADVVIFLVDASYGFEMETFEFMTIIKTTGYTTVMAAMTKCDLVPMPRLKKKRKMMKRRWKKDVGQGGKFFFFNEIVSGGRFYKRSAITNFHRLLVNCKVKKITWRDAHPYMVVNRCEDVTNPAILEQDPSSSRTMSFYGWVRGVPLHDEQRMHLLGVGDFDIAHISAAVDPCALDDKLSRKRHLGQKLNLFYAPWTELGEVVVDDDAAHIVMADRIVNDVDNEEYKKVSELQQEGMFSDDDDIDLAFGTSLATDSKKEEVEEIVQHDIADVLKEKRRPVSDLFEFKDVSAGKMQDDEYFDVDSDIDKESDVEDTVELDELDGISDIVHTGGSAYIDGRKIYVDEQKQTEEDSDLEVELDDFDDLVESEKEEEPEEEEEPEDKEEPEEMTRKQLRMTRYQERIERRERLKKLLGMHSPHYEKMKRQIEEQEEREEATLKSLDDDDKVNLVGYHVGAYVCIILQDVAPEFAVNCKKIQTNNQPIVLGGFEQQESEENLRYCKARVKKHQYYPRLLKSLDPIIMSMGWRRFQTIPAYIHTDEYLRNSESSERMRFVKYTPDFMHCECVFYAPVHPLNTQFIGFQTLENETNSFRVACTGTVLEVKKKFKVVKKLNLVGEPFEILKKTAFVHKMFSTKEEAAMFVGAKISTVSGVRGQIKSIETGKRFPPGCVRAKFEDRVLVSDLIRLKGWVGVDIPKFYNPLATFIGFNLMRTTGKLRHDLGLKSDFKRDSVYKPVERKERKFHKMRVPAAVAKNLPFKSRLKVQRKQVTDYERRRQTVQSEEETRREKALNRLDVLYSEKWKKQQKQQKAKIDKHNKEYDRLADIQERKRKQSKKDFFARKKQRT